HGEYEKMIEQDLPFSPSTARKLVAIACNPILSDRAHVHALPPHWGTLHQLALLPEARLQALIDDGTVCPDMERADVEALREPSKPAKNKSAGRARGTDNGSDFEAADDADEVDEERPLAGTRFFRGANSPCSWAIMSPGAPFPGSRLLWMTSYGRIDGEIGGLDVEALLRPKSNAAPSAKPCAPWACPEAPRHRRQRGRAIFLGGQDQGDR
ncbi:MAG: hypothetical protein ACM3JD_19870, partial [Rudaea sp.]